jgi:hypothetical protein
VVTSMQHMLAKSPTSRMAVNNKIDFVPASTVSLFKLGVNLH